MKRMTLLLLCACMLLPLMAACGDRSGSGGLGTVNVLGSAGAGGTGNDDDNSADNGANNNANGDNNGANNGNDGNDNNGNDSNGANNGNNGANNNGNGNNGGGSVDTNDEDSVMYGGGELRVYPAYTQIPAGYAVYLDYGTDPAGRDVAWESSDTSVATVASDGMITAISAGEATITASLRDNPGVSAYGVMRVVEYDESEYAQHYMLIWEDEPPSLLYQATMYDRELTEEEADSVPDYEPGYNVPISIPLDDDDNDDDAAVGGLASGGAANNGATVGGLANGGLAQSGAASNERAPVAGFLTSSPGQPRKTTRINKKDLRNKLKTNAVWSILVEDDHVDYGDYFMNNYQNFYMYVQKTGGDTLAGTYTGVSWYTMYYDYRKHYAKYPDHSLCPDCSQRWRDDYTGEVYRGFTPPVVSGSGTSLEWVIFEEATITGNYTGKTNPAELFTISRFDIEEDGRYEEDPRTSWQPRPVRRKLWVSLDVDVGHNYTWVGNKPTNTGGNWGESHAENDSSMLFIRIYVDNTVMVNDRYFGTVTKSAG